MRHIGRVTGSALLFSISLGIGFTAHAGGNPAGTPLASVQDSVLAALKDRSFSCGKAVLNARRRAVIQESAYDDNAGIACVGPIDGYPQPVAIVIPAHYKVTANASFLFYFHGFNTAPVYDLPAYLYYYKYLENLNQAGRNILMVAPLGYGGPVKEHLDLTDPAHPERLNTFVGLIESLLGDTGLSEASELDTLLLMSHSGGYHPIANLLKQAIYDDNIRSVYLLDSLYGEVDTYSNFASSPSHRFWSAYGPNFAPGYTGQPNSQMMSGLDSSHVDHVHFRLGQAPLREHRMHALTADEVSSNRVGFIQTDLDHVGTVHNFMGVFLSGEADLN